MINRVILPGMVFRIVISLMAATAASWAQAPAVEKLDDTRLKVGEVTFDSKSREIRFPAAVNLSEGTLEFLIVHRTGKVHEALLQTAISPTHLNLAFTLLRYPASKELESVPRDSPDPVKISAETKAAARLAITVEWDDAGKIRRVPINEWVQFALTGGAMPSGPWLYTGSAIRDGKFLGETTGDIAAIFTSESAIIAYPGPNRDDDTVWFSYPKRVPPNDTKVTVIISPYQAEPLPKP